MILSIYNGRSRWVWPYTVRISNHSGYRIQLKGRRLLIKEGAKGAVEEHIPFSGFAPSIGGEQRILEPNESWSYRAGAVSDDATPPTISGTFDCIDLDRHARSFISLLPFSFDKPARTKIEDGPAVLGPRDSKLLCEAIDRYERDRQEASEVLFRPDRIGVSKLGFSCINRFLVDYFRENRGKSTFVDFKPLLLGVASSQSKSIIVNDHYFAYSEVKTKSQILSYVLSYNKLEVTKESSADAGSMPEIEEAYRRYGFKSVAQKLLGIASPEERALIVGMVGAAGKQAGDGQPKPTGLRSHALPPGAPIPLSFSRKHVADLTPAEREIRREADRIRQARRREKKNSTSPS